MVSKKNLKVISTMENDEHDKNHILLTRNTIEELGLLTGDSAVIKNSGRTLKGQVRSYMNSFLSDEYWDDDEIPLTKHQMRELNVSEGSEVTVDIDLRVSNESSGFQPNNNISDVNNVEDLVEDSGDIPTNTDTEQMTNVTYDDIGGLDDILEDIRMLIQECLIRWVYNPRKEYCFTVLQAQERHSLRRRLQTKWMPGS
jgi:ATP-dependent 26S proteasome regulatory subunit